MKKIKSSFFNVSRSLLIAIKFFNKFKLKINVIFKEMF